MARLLLLFGLGFLIADVRALVEQVRYWQRRRTALLTWPAARPPFFVLQVGIGVAIGVLFVFNLLFRPAAAEQLFGEGMMLLYYGYVVPMSTRIERGFYRDGVWTDRRFIRYGRIGAVTWREGRDPVLLLAARTDPTAALMVVPSRFYGAVRRILRDLIGTGVLKLADTGLHLGLKDYREDV
ncbi:MAG TPA: hypothetical protein VGK32_11365 [Vicinamibacterales bacterium]|jgi:hypothetical protein